MIEGDINKIAQTLQRLYVKLGYIPNGRGADP